jgi:alanine racemase
MNQYFELQPKPNEIRQQIKGLQSWIEINLNAIEHNLEEIKKKTKVEIIPCVKSNAYGHGIIGCVAFLETKGIKRVLVAKLWEAEQLREAGINCGIINIDPIFSAENYHKIIELGITHTVYQKKVAETLNEIAEKHGEEIDVWVKIDTGLGRVGVRWDKAVELITYIEKLPNLTVEGTFSTFSENDEMDKLQFKRFHEIDHQLKQQGITVKTKSIASSNAVFRKPYSYLNAIRPGLMLFGLYPDEEDREHGITLKQSLTFKARLEHVKWVEKGEALTYSRRFISPKRMKVGTAHIGYSDGYPRGLTKKGLVKVQGRIKPILGTVSVNHTLIDLDETNAQVGEEVEAISTEGQNDASHLAELAGIMTYSLGNHLNMLTPRVYFYDEEPVAIYQPKLSDELFNLV